MKKVSVIILLIIGICFVGCGEKDKIEFKNIVDEKNLKVTEILLDRDDIPINAVKNSEHFFYVISGYDTGMEGKVYDYNLTTKKLKQISKSAYGMESTYNGITCNENWMIFYEGNTMLSEANLKVYDIAKEEFFDIEKVEEKDGAWYFERAVLYQDFLIRVDRESEIEKKHIKIYDLNSKEEEIIFTTDLEDTFLSRPRVFDDKILWITKDGEDSYLYSYFLETKRIEEEKLKIANPKIYAGICYASNEYIIISEENSIIKYEFGTKEEKILSNEGLSFFVGSNKLISRNTLDKTKYKEEEHKKYLWINSIENDEVISQKLGWPNEEIIGLKDERIQLIWPNYSKDGVFVEVSYYENNQRKYKFYEIYANEDTSK